MTRIAASKGRVVLARGDEHVDVAVASGGRFGPDPQQVFAHWDDFVAWAARTSPGEPQLPADGSWDSPVGRPRMVIAAGVNHPGKFASIGVDAPASLGIVSKLPTAYAGPDAPIPAASQQVYVEVELALVIGRPMWRVPAATALDHVLGATIALDITDAAALVVAPANRPGSRDVVYFNPAKSLPGYCPFGPVVAGLDDLGDLTSLVLELHINNQLVQRGTLTDLHFSAAEMLAQVSALLPLEPGDVVLTGSPGWVDGSRAVAVGDEVVATITGLGEQRHRVVAA
ncbi:fumarylacetoacetate hydrolase family protein [Micromonospora zingiberis]|uniref:Fumarylacetoacetate hydrolase family protein n=1 Tax=Micromonospora zingiberis TaxID=2053011 RepID=A0A4R0GJQ4_9ACTN|nr:fumarylacetoacetate hydrolase family protein [Micromonospora zingiberis]TCB96712.1 fumarylacetoacetate hydrolase family protein [Micromonospora zingiberis]